MRTLRLSLSVLAVAALLGCSDEEDASQPVGGDTGVVVDTAVTPMDTNTTPMDTNTTPMDTNTTPMDTSVMDTSVMDTAPMPTKHTVNVGSAAGANTFSPATLSIKVGDTVEWVWMGLAHTVTETTDGTSCTAKSGGFDSGLRNSGGMNFSRTFTAAGTVNYICTPHCSLGMRGTITVTP